ncbi:toll-like receptor 4 [Mercenaria mercenaria]|uniref:toll-like receptor 4 n=1 Tax=Mercenaria mercenaria TaxID=6596 RepID=UPI00234E4454|nr:toll-like receptor 4 [Mercenaria mercenaria]
MRYKSCASCTYSGAQLLQYKDKCSYCSQTMATITGKRKLPVLKMLANLLVVSMVTPVCPSITRLEEAEGYKLPYYCAFCVCQNVSDRIITNCSGKGLFKFPKDIDARTKEFDLSNNLIKTIKYSYLAHLYSLVVLDLSKNTISNIEIGAFRDLSNLTHLFLHGQITKTRLVILQNVLKPGVFDGLISLKVLHVHDFLQQPTEAHTSVIPTNALKVLTTLEELHIDGVLNVTFSEDFNLLKNLTTVVISGFEGMCEIGHLDRKSFVGLENVRNLTVNKCRIRTLQTGTFWWTPNLSYLDMSWNTELEINQFGRILEELKYTKLHILKINAIHNPNRAGTEILRPDVKYLRDIDLIELYMDDNGIEFVDYGVFDMFPKSLQRLYLRRNKLTFGLYMYEAVFNNPNLEVLDVGDQAVASRSDRAFTSQFRKVYGLVKRDTHVHPYQVKVIKHLVHTAKRQFYRKKDMDSGLTKKRALKKRSNPTPVLNLKTLISSGSMSDLRPLDFSATLNNITFIDLSRNFIPLLEPHAFDGLGHLKHLNLSNNYMENAHKNAFYGLSSVHVMDLDNNLLGHLLKLDRNGKFFSSLVKLRIISLSRNRINSLDKNVFKHNSELEIINLSENYIESLDIELSALSNLRYFDLSYNRLYSLPSSVSSHLSNLSKYHPVNVDLSNNNLYCSCDNIPFLKWVFYSDVKFQRIESYYCSFDDKSVRIFNESRHELLNELEEKCKSYLALIIGNSAGISFILAVLVSYTVYYNRWKLRYVYYMTKIKLDKRHGNEAAEEVFNYDVFVSYGDGDRGFVTVDMLKNLEVIGGKRLNIRDRDFELGEVIAVNISKAIRTSKKTFLLLSRHFLRNKWCNFEMNMARMEAVHMKRDVIVIIFLEKIPPKVLPLEIMDLLRECPNMDLPKDEELRVAFWQKCIDYINHN